MSCRLYIFFIEFMLQVCSMNVLLQVSYKVILSLIYVNEVKIIQTLQDRHVHFTMSIFRLLFIVSDLVQERKPS